jgi:hypothetical protein
MAKKLTKRDYKRQYMRDIRGRPWLNDFEGEATKLGLTLKQAVDAVLSEVARRRMIKDFLRGTDGQ